MEIEIRNFRPNPFRNIKEYPINRAKIRSLIKSIEDTTFWDNILARPAPGDEGKFQIAYGHHRLIALQKIHGESSRHKIDIPIRDLDDSTMLKIMANENATDWVMDTAVVIETIKATSRFLFLSDEKLSLNGTKNIMNFLGGVFTERMIDEALAIIHAIDRRLIDDKAVKIIKEPSKAAEFVRAIKQSEKPIDKETQRAIAKEIAIKEIPTTKVKEHLHYHGHTPAPKPAPDVLKFLNDNRWKVDQLVKYVNQLKEVKTDLRGIEWITFRAACVKLAKALNELLMEQKGNNYGEKEKRRTIEQRQTRALPEG